MKSPEMLTSNYPISIFICAAKAIIIRIKSY